MFSAPETIPNLEHDDLPEDADGDDHEVEHEDEAEEREPHGGGEEHGQGPGHSAQHDGEVLQRQPAVQQPHQQLVEVDDGVPDTYSSWIFTLMLS